MTSTRSIYDADEPIQPSTTTTMDFSKESYAATYTKVADGWVRMLHALYHGTPRKILLLCLLSQNRVYVISQTHRPHHKDSMPELNNRAFLFEVSTKEDGKHLLMSGLPGSKAVDNVKQLEKDVGLKLKMIVSSGDFHHMSMKGWLDAFPHTTFVQSGLKFPTTRNGKEILANQAYSKRIILEKKFEMPSLEKYADTIKFYGFNQFLTYADAPFMTASEDKAGDTKARKQNIMSYMSKIGPIDQLFLAIWVYHVPTKQLLIEHNFMPYLSKEQIGKASLMLRMMMKSNQFASAANEKMPTGPKTMAGCKVRIIHLTIGYSFLMNVAYAISSFFSQGPLWANGSNPQARCS